MTAAHPAICSCHAPVDEWYTEYAGMLRGYLQTRVHDPLVADECTSETFVRAIARRRHFRCSGDGVRPWLFTIARNIAHDYEKKAWRRRETLVDDLRDARAAAPTPTPEQTVVSAAHRAELRAALRWCIEQLPENQRRCVQLRFLAGLTVAQTAQEMGRDAGAIRSLQFRAVRNLAKSFHTRIPQQRVA